MIVFNRIPCIVVQFLLFGADSVPPFIKSMGGTLGTRLPRTHRDKGEQVYGATEKCSIADLPGSLNRMEYLLVGASYFERIPRNNPNSKKLDQVVRYVFAHPEDMQPSPDVRKWEDMVNTEFKELCAKSMFRFRMFSDPISKEGEVEPSQLVLNINLCDMKPLFRPDGKPMVDWPKDAQNRVCGTPRPVRPERRLLVLPGNGMLTLQPC
jgi:hypothetical protein